MKKLLGLLLCSLLLVPNAYAASSVVTETAAGAPGKNLVATEFLVSGSYTPTSNLIFVTGCAAGSGGAGGWSNATGGGGGGGAAGTCISRAPFRVAAGTALTITIGTAGLGAAIAANGGIVNVNTIIAGLPIGTYTLYGPATAASAGSAANGGAGANINGIGGNGAAASGAGNAATCPAIRTPGGDPMISCGGGSGGGATGPGAGGSSGSFGGYSSANSIAGGSISGASGGGGAGGSSGFGVGGIGGNGAGAGNACTIGYGAGGGGGGSNAAGANGCAGFLRIEEWK